MFAPASRRMLSSVSKGGATVRKVPSSVAFIMFTVVEAVPSVVPPVGLLRITAKRVLFVTSPFRRMGIVMVLTVSFSGNARVPETAW